MKKEISATQIICLKTYSREMARVKSKEFSLRFIELTEKKFPDLQYDPKIKTEYTSHRTIKTVISTMVYGDSDQIKKLCAEMEKISDPEDLFDRWGWNILN